MPLLSVEDLAVYFQSNGSIAFAVDGVSFSLDSDQTLGLVGESGCGKTVTALSILQLISRQNLSTFSGRIYFDGTDLMTRSENQLREIRGRDISMIFQEPMTSLNPVLTVGKQIHEVYSLHQGLTRKQSREKGILLLDNVGIRDGREIWKSYPGQLSGGMRQRVMIAIAIAARPKLLIADEPTTALDVTVQAQVLDLMDRLKREIHAGVLLVSHDLGVIAEVCDQVCVMYAGKIVEHSDVKTLFTNPLHPYTQGLLNAIQTLDQGRIAVAIKGQVSPATSYPPGCRFHPRCPKSFDLCSKEAPSLLKRGCSQVACHLY